MAEKHSGHCYCGAVTMTSDRAPKWVAHCHCADCRRSTGAAFSTFAGFDKEAVRISGPLKKADSSGESRRGFCSECGTSVSFEGLKWPGEIHLTIGFLDEPEKYQPLAHVQLAEKLPWLVLGDDGAKQYSRFKGGE